MRHNPVKAKLRDGKPVFGAWLSLGDLHTAKMLARAGFDWLLIDLEHSPIDWFEASVLIDTVAETGCVPIVRVPEGNHHYIKRAVDAGAWGIMAPMIDTAEHAQQVIAAAKYPPQGNRSVGAYLPMVTFDATPEEYLYQANDEILVVLQIESPHGIRNMDAICQLPGCDVAFIGTYDLWRNLPPSADGKRAPREDLESAIAQILSIGRNHGTPVGIFTLSAEEAASRAQQGFLMPAAGSDAGMLAAKLAEETARLSLRHRGEIGRYS
jgi:4-hydroxy-2-oxoheptanedioate aldolase